MANNPIAGGSDPALIRQVERQLSEAVASSRGLPVVSDDEAVFLRSTATVSNNEVIINRSSSNDLGDTVSVVSGRNINVTAIDQTINRYTSVNSGVSSVIAGNGIAVSSQTGDVTFSVSGFGNVSTINLDGNSSNVLRGDGTWAADAESNYGNSNVVSLLGSFGSNTITTTGNVSVGNISADNLGNISEIDLDGNSANYLDGTGSWGPLSITLSGDGGNISNIQGANVSGEVSFAATANAVALGNVSGAGNIASINLDGNVSNVLRGDGTFAADSEGTYGDGNVVSLLGAFGSNTISTTGNVSVGTLSGSNGAAFISTVDNQFVVERDNGTSFRFKGNNIDGNAVQTYAGIFYNAVFGNTPETQTRLIIGSNEDVSIELQTSNEMRISAVDDNTGGGKVRIASGDGNGSPHAIEFHPGTQAEVDNLVVKIDTDGLEVTGNLSATGNISALNLGNIASINLDGNASNVLRGDGTFAADAEGTYGDSNVVSLLASFGSNAISTTGLLTADGGGLSNVPYANVTGTPTLGNVSAINLDGNVSNVLRGDGTFAADANSSYGDSNVVSLLGSFGSNSITTTGTIEVGKVHTPVEVLGVSSATVEFDCTSTQTFAVATVDQNFVANFTNLNLGTRESTDIRVYVTQQATPYDLTGIEIGGVSQTVRWAGNVTPTGTSLSQEIWTFKILTNAGGLYFVHGEKEAYQ